MPTVSFFLATSRHPIDDRHPLWNQPLPANRHGAPTEGPEASEDNRLSYGRYFCAVERFCSASGWQHVLCAAADKLVRPLTADELESVSIFLEKHGAFYHPARIEVTISGQRVSLAVNVATSRLGKETLVRETGVLTHLNEQRPFDWFPVVYAKADDNPPMFLADWFEGFHEFHLTRTHATGDMALVVWDGAAAPRLLSDVQTAALYRNMAMILTACYDPVSSRQIFPWHLAAGDFVVRVDGQHASVKLITVRNYIPLPGGSAAPEDERELLEALLLFFLHMSMRMRLDRLDGVSEIVWAPERCLAPIIQGFFQGLDLTARLSGFPEDFPRIFQQFAGAWRVDALLPVAGRIGETVFGRNSEERRVIDCHMETHLEAVVRLLSE